MELRHLRCFLAVAEELHFARAAERLHIEQSDGVTPSRLPALLAMCRQEEPEVEIRLFEVPLPQQLKGLQDDLYDVGFFIPTR
ncbi:hypothetical protein MnBA_27630 [Marinobacterium sp. BA1]